MEDPRPTKRARQACEPCRKKKSKCPGDRPICSTCRRLKQACHYNAEDEPRTDTAQSKHMRLESRMDSMETKLDQLLQHLSPSDASPSRATVMSGQPLSPPSTLAYSLPAQHTTWLSEPVPPGQTSNPSLIEAGNLYITWCHNQPILLFDEDTFVDSLARRDRDIQLAVQALSLRFPPGSLTAQRQETVARMAKECRRLVMERIASDDVELSTMQSLCLLAIISFTDGRIVRAGLDLDTAYYLASRLYPGSVRGDSQECTRCVEAIMQLRRLQGPILPKGMPVGIPEHIPAILAKLDPKGRKELDIVGYSYKLGAVWQAAREYAARPIEEHQLPPWNPQSDYSSVMQHHLELDSSVPLGYRFAENRFDERSLEDLQENRPYWAPWLFLQMVYAAIPCLLNHPFLLSMRLRNFRRTMPQMFIHQSFDHITRHAGWIVFFLDMIEKKGFETSDPVLAHTVVIVATIHLQHSFVEDPVLQQKAQVGFEKCMRFLLRMGRLWPNISTMAQNLKKLQNSVTIMNLPEEQNRHNSDDGTPKQKWFIDAQLLRELLIYERAGLEDGKPDQSIFAPSLTSTTAAGNPQEDAATEFSLVGSAGISGHRSVPKGVPVYAPGEHRYTLGDQSTARDTEFHIDDGLFEIPSLMNDQDRAFLQSNDFGRAIDSWLNF